MKMKRKSIYKVTFRNSTDKLTSMFDESYKSIAEAKTAIIVDSTMFLKAHHYHGGPVGMKFRQKSRWINPKSEDYYFAQGQDGTQCVWQYFKVSC